MSEITVRNRPQEHRYEVHVDGAVAGFAAYTLAGDVITFVHTEVDDAHEGEGLGSVLARGALDDVRASGALRVRATCPFIAVWLRRHHDYDDLLASAPAS